MNYWSLSGLVTGALRLAGVIGSQNRCNRELAFCGLIRHQHLEEFGAAAFSRSPADLVPHFSSGEI
jgi:hypothetical protein